jgi:hypothetical protein
MAYTTIDDPSAYFQTALYNGNAGTQSIVNDGNSDLQPDMVWIKCRSGTHATENHNLFDSVRGANKFFIPNGTTASSTDTNSLTAFNTDGFSLGTRTDVNGSGAYVGWQWKKTATAGFDIVAYNGTGSSQNISHSLSAAPTMMIIKNRTGTVRNWGVYHQGLSNKADDAIYLDLNNVASTGGGDDWWNSTNPTSSVFSVGTRNEVNESGSTYIAYLFAEKKGYSKFGSYTGNGNADGTFVYTGFKPAWVMVKPTTTADNWVMFDNKRLGYNPDNNFVYANKSNAENDADIIDFTSNGFKQTSSGGTSNRSGDTFIYMAFAENPFVTSSGVPACAR